VNVLLIYPRFPDTFWSFRYALRFIGKKAAFPSPGLLTVAALLPEEWSKRVVDFNVDDLTDNDFSWADMAFIGGMAVQQESARQIISVMGGFIVGFDRDTHSIFQRQIDFIQKSGIVAAMVGILHAPLGTRVSY
jgi:hypothetical protein